MNILFIGASVTSQHGYRIQLLKNIENLLNNKFSETILSVGATCSNTAYYLMDTINKLEYDIVFYEYYTGDLTSIIDTYSINGISKVDNTDSVLTLDDINIYLEKIIRKLLYDFKCKNIIFLNLYRSDINYNNDIINIYDRITNYYNLFSLNIHKYINENNIDPSLYFYDMCHTSTDGGVLYGDLIFNLLKDELYKQKLFVELPKLNYYNESNSILYIEDINIVGNIIKNTYTLRNINYTYYILNKDNSLIINNITEIFGILCVTNIESGYINIIIDNNEIIKLNTFDKYSYYDRIKTLNINKKIVKELKITYDPNINIDNTILIRNKPSNNFINNNIKIIGIFI